MFPYVEYILYRLKKILLDNYNTYYDKVNEHANNVYTNQLNEPDLVMEDDIGECSVSLPKFQFGAKQVKSCQVFYGSVACYMVV